MNRGGGEGGNNWEFKFDLRILGVKGFISYTGTVYVQSQKVK